MENLILILVSLKNKQTMHSNPQPKPNMKNSILLIAAGLTLCVPANIHAQGSLTPPAGPPAPVMKSLAQIEPRTDVVTLPIGLNGAYSITQPGSYYLTANLVGGAAISGIEIKTNNVTIDLNGFALIGAGGIRGICVNGTGFQRIAVRNGRVTGYYSGIDCASVLGTNNNVTVEDVQVVGFGGTGKGITCGEGLQVRRCQISGFSPSSSAAIIAGSAAQISDCLVQSNYAGIMVGSNSVLRAVIARSHSIYGISVGSESQVLDCEATSNGSDGIEAGSNSVLSRCLASKNNQFGVVAQYYSTINACSANSNGSGGITAYNNSLIRDCNTSGNLGGGIAASPPASILNCIAVNNTGNGIESGGLINGCNAADNGGDGISVGDKSSVVNNMCSGNGSDGIHVYGANSSVVNNTCSGNGTAADSGIFVNAAGGHIENNTASGHLGYGFKFLGNATASIVVANKARGNGTNYLFLATPMSFGPVVNVSGGGMITTNSPWANFSY